MKTILVLLVPMFLVACFGILWLEGLWTQCQLKRGVRKLIRTPLEGLDRRKVLALHLRAELLESAVVTWDGYDEGNNLYPLQEFMTRCQEHLGPR